MDVSILPAADISWNSHKITSLADPTLAQDAATKNWCETTQTASVITSLGAQAENLNMNSHQIDNVTDPTANQDAATKNYVDGKVAIVKGTHYWSCSGTRFLPGQPDVNEVIYSPYTVSAVQDNVIFALSADLPHGAIVTGAIVYGNTAATAETWNLERVSRAGGNAVMATANIGTEDTSINNATIDNVNYSYVLRTSTVDTNDTIYGARITYTL